METVRDFIFLGSKITADGDCSYEIKRYLLLGRKAMTNLDSILKKIHYFLTKVLLVKSICKASSDNHFAFLHIFFLRMVLITASCTMS